MRRRYSHSAVLLYGSLNLTGPQAAGADMKRLVGSADIGAYILDIRLPRPCCLAVGVGNIVAKRYTFIANIAFCHLYIPPFQASKFLTILL